MWRGICGHVTAPAVVGTIKRAIMAVDQWCNGALMIDDWVGVCKERPD